jgi:anti-sigma factor RsiW
MADALQDWHPSEEEVLRHVDGELSARASSRILSHLEACWACRARVDRLQETIRAFTELVEGPLTAELPDPPRSWSGFAAALRRVADGRASSHSWAHLAKALTWRLAFWQTSRARRVRRTRPTRGKVGTGHPSAAAAFRRTVLLTGCVALIVFVAVNLRSPTVSAAHVLRSADRADRAFFESPGTASYRVLHMEARRRPGPALISRATVEVWQDGQSGLKARRLYDEQHTLVAGEWIDRQGVRTLYERAGPSARSDARETGEAPAVSFADAWRWEPSPADFIRLTGGAEATVRRTGGSFVLSYGSRENTSQPGLLEASLTVRQADWRVTRQTLVVQQTSEIREYRFIEQRVDRVPAAQAVSRFTPERELLNLPAPLATLTDTRAASSLLTPLPRAVVYPSPTELDRLELEACYRVHRFNLCLEEPSGVTRTPAGVRVNALVESEGQRAVLLHALEPISRHTALAVDVEARDGAPPRDEPARSATATADLPASTGPAPATGALRRYMRAQTRDGTVSAGALDDAIAMISAWALQRSAKRVEEIRAVRQLLARWPLDRVQRLGPETAAMWHAMLAQHAHALRTETSVLRRQLQPMLFPTLTDEHRVRERAKQESRGLS